MYIFSPLINATVGRLLSVGVNFGVAILCARLTSPEVAGLYFWLASAQALLASILSLGTYTVAQGRFIRAESHDEKSSHQLNVEISSRLYLIFIFSLILIPFVSLAGHFFGPPMRIEGSEISSWLKIFFLGLALAVNLYLAEYMRFKNFNFLSTFSSTVVSSSLVGLLILFFWVIKVDLNRELILNIVCAAQFFGMAFIFFCVFYKLKFSLVAAVDFVGFKINAMATLANVASYVITQSHVFLAGLFFDAETAASVALASRVAAIMQIIPSAVSQSAMPSVVRLISCNNKREAESVIRRVSAIGSVPALMIGGTLLIWPNQVVSILFGSKYSDGSSILSIIAMATLINILRGPSGSILLALGEARAISKLITFSALVSLVMFSLASIVWGVDGLVWAVLLATATQCFGENYILKNNFSINSLANFRSFSVIIRGR